MQVYSQPAKDAGDFNFFKIMGNNTYGSLGIGLDDNQTTTAEENKVNTLKEFTNKMVYSMAVGNYHTLVVASEANCPDIPGFNK